MFDLYEIYDKSLRVLYPQTCYFCGELCKEPICEVCRKKVVYVKEPRCKCCGKMIRYEEQEFCEDCEKKKWVFEQGKSVWLHKEPVSWSIYQFKYHNRRVYGAFYAKEMWRLYERVIKVWKIDAIVPVPLHWKRKLERGYNQAEIVAKFLGKYSGIPVRKYGIKRMRQTERQKNLDSKNRMKNLNGAFQVTSDWKKVRNVLVIDDIYTTGSTMNEIAKVLKAAGTEKIFFLTISIGQGF